ncbi:MAG: signal peptide peptidase SppA, partial [Bacteroidia bacterium]|nr:signal peptide peptidase SppA [Bacteroidia bacterium]
PEVIRHGKFKSAVEPFILDKMSPENKEQTLTFVGSIWNHINEGISRQRKISTELLNQYADSMKIRNAQAAVTYKLIDALKYKDEVMDEMKGLVKTNKKKDLNFISLNKYTKAPKTGNKKGFARDKIAVIYASGDIVSGTGNNDEIGSDKLAKTIHEAWTDSTIKAIVLRVNSPGGSALASEVIWRESTLAKKAKPLIVSMGDVAASGGYYISCAADSVIANPNTITGSIGVFGLLFNAKKFMNDKLGITSDGVGTNKYSDFGSITRPLNSAEKEVIQQEIENVYDVFITHVSEGRKISKEKVDEIGQGRVWSGVNAKELSLVDSYGGLQTAIEIAARKAKTDNYRVIDLPRQKDTFQQIMDEISGDVDDVMIKKELGTDYSYYMQMKKCLTMKGIQARLPFVFDIN